MVKLANNVNDSESFNYGLTPEVINTLDEYLEQGNYQILSNEIKDLHPADIADYISTCNNEYRQKFVEFLAPEFDAQILLYVDYHFLNNIVEQIGFDNAATVISELELNDAVYVIENLEPNIQTYILSLLPEAKKASLSELLSYPLNSVGRIMKPKMITAMEYWTVGQTIDYLRKNKNNYHNIQVLYVLDLKHKPIGIIQVNELIYNHPNDLIRKITEQEFKVVCTEQDKEEVAILFKQYQLSSIPVVNKDGRIVGIITLEDIVDIVAEEAEEDILKLGGLQETDLNLSFVKSAKKRLPWLIVNFITALLTVYIIRLFDDTIENMVVLASIMPIVASLGGNAGTQTLTVIVSSFAMRDIMFTNIPRMIVKEALTCILNGVFIGIVGGGIILYLNQNVELSIIFTFAIIVNFFVAGFMGSLIPVVLKRFGADPAVSSSIFLTAATDIVGFWSFLILAQWFLI